MNQPLRCTALATALLGLLAPASGCGHSNTPTTGSGATAGSGAAGGSTDTGACEVFQGQATAAEINLSPFTNAEAEILALEASAKLLAPQHVYERILADLTLICAQNAPLQQLVASPS